MKLFKSITLVSSAMAMFFSAANAAVPAEEAAKLGGELTPFGAIQAGNADGSIPAWQGGITEPPSGLGYEGDGDHHPDPFADDEVLFKIDATNAAEHADKLSDGVKAMLEQYKDTFYLNVYQSRRTHAMPEWVYDNTKKNAVNAELVEGGNGVVGAYGGVPFPMPATGQEVVWNHLMRYTGAYRSYIQTWVHKDPGGAETIEVADAEMQLPYYDKDGNIDDWNGEILLLNFRYKEPGRKKGEFIMFREAANALESPRRAWRYLPGARRVRRAPTIAYDSPIGPVGSRTVDDTRAFNGAIDRYDWKLIGKQEMYIPYNSYNLESDQLKLSDILTPKHINQEHARWELHRVWVVEATIADGKRHVYAKRRFYIDEDSWSAVLIDAYDTRGNLWRVTNNHVKNLYENPYTDGKTLVIHDLQAGSYQALGLHNEQSFYMYTQKPMRDDSYFTPAKLRTRAKR